MNDKLWYTRPASAWEEALPLGCGNIGAMIYGSPVCELISLNEDTLWSGTPKRKDNPTAKNHLPEIRRLLSEKKTVEAEELINRHTLGQMCETYLPFCDLKISSQDGEISEYRRELDISRGIFSLSCKKNGARFFEEAFVSYPAKLAVIKIKCERAENFTLSLSSKLRYKTSQTSSGAEIFGIAPEENLPTVRGITPPTVYGNEDTSEAIRFFGALMILTDGKYVPSEFAIYGAKDLEIRVSLATSFVSPFDVPRADAKARAYERLEGAKKLSYNELFEAHVADFVALSSRFDIVLGESEPNIPTNERLALVCQGEKDPAFAALLVKYGRYLMISASREGSQAMNLQGIWNDKLHPAWCSNYTVNINTEMNYWCAEPTGLSECAEPLMNFIANIAESGARTARLHYGCRGWVCHCNSDIWAYTTSCGPTNKRRGCSRYATWQGSTGWLCRHLWEHYLYSGDIGFLRRAYPVMLEAARFYIDFMFEKNGYLVTSPSLSPENIYFDENGNTVSADVMPSMDKEIISELFENCLKAAKALSKNGDIIDRIRSSIQKIAPLKINADGSLCEWSEDFPEAEPEHRHVSHLYGLYPSNSINKNTPALARAAQKTLEKRKNQGTGWGIMWKTCLYARLGLAEEAYKMFSLIYNRLPPNAPMGNTGGGLYDNLFDACPPFQIDGNLGAVAAVCEMLCRADEKGYELLPACPKEWHSGNVRGLCLPGGKKIDFSWNNGKVTYVKEY